MVTSVPRDKDHRNPILCIYCTTVLVRSLSLPNHIGEQHPDREPGRQRPAAVHGGVPDDAGGDRVQAVARPAVAGRLPALGNGTRLHRARIHTYHHRNRHRQVKSSTWKGGGGGEGGRGDTCHSKLTFT